MLTPESLQRALRELQLARMHAEGKMWSQAAANYVRAAQAMPDHADIHAELAVVAEALADWPLMATASRHVLRLRPRDEKACWRLGVALAAQEQYEEAIPLLCDYAQRRPGYEVEFNIATCLNRLRRYGEAIPHLRRALRHDSTREETWSLLAVDLALAGDRSGSAGIVAAASDRFPGNPDIGFLAADHHLRHGRYAEGFDGYHHRLASRMVQIERRELSCPEWRGEAFAGTLAIWAEQGVGDELLYAGMLPDLRARHPDIVMECDDRLQALFARSFPGIRLASRQRNEILAAAGLVRQSAAGDLCRIFRRSRADFPARVGWLQPDPARVAALRARYAAMWPGKRLVGISWSSRQRLTGVAKSMSLEDLLPVLAVPGMQFVNLQYGDVGEQVRGMRDRHGIDIFLDQEIDAWNDLDGFSAQVAALDHVVTTSNTTVHFAGSLGKSCDLLLNSDMGLLWYWGESGDRTPWHPSVQLWRTGQRGDWAPLVAQVAAGLARRVAISAG